MDIFISLPLLLLLLLPPPPYAVRVFLNILFLFMFILCKSMERKAHLKNEWKKKQHRLKLNGLNLNQRRAHVCTVCMYACMCTRDIKKGQNTYFHTMFVSVLLTFYWNSAVIQRIFHRFIRFYFTLRVSVSLIMLVFLVVFLCKC